MSHLTDLKSALLTLASICAPRGWINAFSRVFIWLASYVHASSTDNILVASFLTVELNLSFSRPVSGLMIRARVGSTCSKKAFPSSWAMLLVI